MFLSNNYIIFTFFLSPICAIRVPRHASGSSKSVVKFFLSTLFEQALIRGYLKREERDSTTKNTKIREKKKMFEQKETKKGWKKYPVSFNYSIFSLSYSRLFVSIRG